MAWAGSEAIQEAAVAPPAAPAHLPWDRSPGPGGCLHACILCSSGQPCHSVCSCFSCIHSFIPRHITVLPSIHPFTCVYIHSFIHSLIHTCFQSYTQPLIGTHLWSEGQAYTVMCTSPLCLASYAHAVTYAPLQQLLQMWSRAC